MRQCLFLLGLLWAVSAQAIPHAQQGDTEVVIQVDVKAHALRLEKLNGNKRVHLDTLTLQTLPDSLHAGVYRPTKLFQRFRSVNGNTYLENVVFFDGSHTIRTTRLYEKMRTAGNPISGSIVLEPEFGNILLQTIHHYGARNTRIIIRK